MTIMLGTIVGKLYGFVLEIINSQCTESERVGVRGQVDFRDGRSTLGSIHTLCIFIVQEIFEGRSHYYCFIDLIKAFDAVLCDKLWHASND